MHYHASLIPHTLKGKPQPSRMFPDPIRVATEVIAAWDARFDDLLFPTREAEAGKSPMVTQPRCPLTPDLGHQTGPLYERGWGPLYTAGIYLFLAALMFFSAPAFTLCLNHGWGHKGHAVVSVREISFYVCVTQRPMWLLISFMCYPLGNSLDNAFCKVNSFTW